MTVREILELSLKNINVTAPGETPSGEDLDDALLHLNVMLDEWNASSLAVFGSLIQDITLVSGDDSYTIGVTTGDFDMVRPQSVAGCYLDNYGGVNLIDEQLMGLKRANASSGSPAYLWYDPEYPLGKLEFYPNPDATYTGKLHYRALFSEIASDHLTDAWAFPPGYQSAIMWNLAERLQAPFSRPADQMVHDMAGKSLKYIKTKNAADRVQPVSLSFLNHLSTRRTRSSSNTIITE